MASISITVISTHVLAHAFAFLSHSDVANAGRACKVLAGAIRSNALWRSMFAQRWPHIDANSTELTSDGLSTGFVHRYRRRLQIDRNWLKKPRPTHEHKIAHNCVLQSFAALRYCPSSGFILAKAHHSHLLLFPTKGAWHLTLPYHYILDFDITRTTAAVIDQMGLHLCDVRSDRAVADRVVEIPGLVPAQVRFLNESQLCVFANDKVVLYNIDKNAVERELSYGHGPFALLLSAARGHFVCTVNSTGAYVDTVNVFDLRNPQNTPTLVDANHSHAKMNCIHIDSDLQQMVVGFLTGRVAVFQLHGAFRLLQQYQHGQSAVRAVSLDFRHVVSASASDTIKVWERDALAVWEAAVAQREAKKELRKKLKAVPRESKETKEVKQRKELDSMADELEQNEDDGEGDGSWTESDEELENQTDSDCELQAIEHQAYRRSGSWYAPNLLAVVLSLATDQVVAVTRQYFKIIDFRAGLDHAEDQLL